jgi:hypothetical protein
MPAAIVGFGDLAEEFEDDSVFLRVRLRVVVGDLVGLLELEALVNQQGRVSAVVDDQFGTGSVRPTQRLVRTPPILLEGLALPGEDRDAGRVLGGPRRAHRDGGCGVVLGREDVAGAPAHVGTESGQRLDQDRRLDGHVQRTGDARAAQRFGGGVLLAQRHQAGHLDLRQLDLLATPLREGEIADLEVQGGFRCCLAHR